PVARSTRSPSTTLCRSTAPAHVRDVQQAVESAQVDERAEVRHVLHDALADLADQQLLHQLLALALALLLEDHATAHDDVATPLRSEEHTSELHPRETLV